MSTLICRNITKTYGKKEVLKSTDLTIEQGKIYGLIGRNGAGKTTLLSIMSAQNPATSGEVTLDGMPVWVSITMEKCSIFGKTVHLYSLN